MKELVFIINGAGLGNSTRCDAIIEELKDINKFELLCSNNSYEYFSKKSDPRLILTQLTSYKFVTNKEGDISFLLTLLCFPLYLITYIKNLRMILGVLKRTSSKIVITDSDYSFVFLRFISSCKFVAINNSLNILRNWKKGKSYILKSIPQLTIECMDAIVHFLFAHRIICPTFGQKQEQKGKTYSVPPIVRSGFYQQSEKHQNDKLKIALIPSGSAENIQSLISTEVLKNQSFQFYVPSTLKADGDNIRNFEKYQNSSSIFKESDMIICNGGMSCLSEVYITGIPALVIPIAGHFEQAINSILISEENSNIRLSSRDSLTSADIISLPKDRTSSTLRSATIVVEMLKIYESSL